jgi:NAD+ diphosphatase
MKPEDKLKYCSICGNKLDLRGPRLLVCTKCGYHHYVNPSPCNAVIIENDNGEILLVERGADPKKGFWDLPGGFIEPGESFDESVRREVREELNVEIEIGKFIGVYHDSYIYQDIEVPTLGLTVTAKITSGEPRATDDIASYKFFPKEEVLKQEIAFKSVEQGLRDYLNKT